MKNSSLKSLLKRPTLEVARGLLGCRLCTTVRGRECSGMIIETEAYHGDIDEACHCFGRKTRRNEVMFGKAGTCYVYFIYGMYYCVNLVTEKEGTGAAVLIRALEPLSGIELMKKRRHRSNLRDLCSGPAKLCQALGITKRFLGEDMLSSNLIRIEPFKNFTDQQVIKTTRIGISKAKELPWRFLLSSLEQK